MNQNKYFIAIDLDGTLLHDDKIITTKTADYLKGLADDGHCVVIATGRPLRSVLFFQEKMGITCPIVCYNGTMAIDYHHNRFPKKLVRFDKHVIKAIINEVGIENLDNVMVETETTIYLLKKDDELNKFFWIEGHNIVYGTDFNFDDDPMTLIFKPHSNRIDMKEKLVRVVTQYPNHNVRFWFDSHYSEVYHSQGTKRDGLEYVAKMLNVDHEHTIACGDNDNDIHMLSWAHHAVVMQNATDDIKAYATLVTEDDNNHDGLVAALQKIIG